MTDTSENTQKDANKIIYSDADLLYFKTENGLFKKGA
jgi:hypothetical protein